MIGNSEEYINKAFREIASRFDYKNIKDINQMSASRYIEFCNDLNAELITAIQEINIIIKNLFEYKHEYCEIPGDINNLLRSLYKRAGEFNNYMLDLMEKDYLNLPEEE